MGTAGPPETHVVLTGHAGMVTAVAYAPDGRLASAGGDGRIILWDVSQRKDARSWKLPGPVFDEPSPSDGRYLATANGNGTVYILRLSS